MRAFVLLLSSVCLILSHSEAAFFGEDVDLADLSKLSPEALNSLRDVEFAVFTAKVKHAGAVETEKEYKASVKSAKSILDAKRMELKAAKTELKDIEQKSVGKKLQKAEEKLAAAQRAHDIARLHVNWKEKELDALAAARDKQRQAVSVAEAERDLARVAKIQEFGVASAPKYRMEDFKKRLEKKKKDYADAVEREKSMGIEAGRLRRDYENALKQQ